MITISKACVRCKEIKPLSDFYTRSGMVADDNPGHYNSECKDCLKMRNKTASPCSPLEPRVLTEQLAIERLTQEGIHALPGKAVAAVDVDVVCWGCVRVEVKYARLQLLRGVRQFKFSATPKQMQRGYLAEIVMLICDYSEVQLTYHLFPSKHPVFYIHDRVKAGFTFTPCAMEAKKHGNNRVVMTQPLMDEYENNWRLIEAVRLAISQRLKAA